ncbi:hypothetical protein Lfu02_31180 [Longispora fulva]|uniref:Uncharacterized protein n=1 Tax=Longispora fulva TaxID=619741 RepID=A0A8J7GLQ8_9ACTN|nr:hypothetical protein [Longispora fulva]MBG6139252.1 hypothetical protein [Longispora fulva]GIG58746.1 hypothetical protein Lfu02_31180 [Longispora fulva]
MADLTRASSASAGRVRHGGRSPATGRHRVDRRQSAALDRLLPSGRDLLGRVDRLLDEGGAPAGHPVLALIARWRVLPGGALEFAAALRPPLTPPPVPGPLPEAVLEWTGPAATRFGAHWTGLRAHQETVIARAEATAEYAAQVSDWMYAVRSDMADALAAALGSAEAVAVRTAVAGAYAGPEVLLAAADLGARVLGAVTAFDPAGWAGRLEEASYVPAAPPSDPGRGFTVNA